MSAITKAFLREQREEGMTLLFEKHPEAISLIKNILSSIEAEKRLHEQEEQLYCHADGSTAEPISIGDMAEAMNEMCEIAMTEDFIDYRQHQTFRILTALLRDMSLRYGFEFPAIKTD